MFIVRLDLTSSRDSPANSDSWRSCVIWVLLLTFVPSKNHFSFAFREKSPWSFHCSVPKTQTKEMVGHCTVRGPTFFATGFVPGRGNVYSIIFSSARTLTKRSVLPSAKEGAGSKLEFKGTGAEVPF